MATVLKAHNNRKVDGSVSSAATQDKRSDVLYAGFKDLREAGFKLDDVHQFAGRHAQVLGKLWESRKLSASTIQNNFSVFRTFAGWIGKTGMIERSEKYVSSPIVSRRATVATVDKSWSSNGFDVAAKIEEIARIDPRVAIQLELQRVFGLRAKESWMLRPHEADKGAYLAVNHGTKGGRDRIVPIVNDWQRDVLSRARELAPRNGSTSDHKRTLAQWKNHYYHTVRKAGITKKKGATSHGLRHERLNEVYREAAGVRSPIQGGLGVPKDVHNAARQEVVEVAGHSAEEKSAAYIGSLRRR